MKKFVCLLVFFSSFILTYQKNIPGARVSFFNFGLDATNQINIDNCYRSILFVPFLIEKDRFGFGVYANPFIRKKYNTAGFKEFDSLINSYLINFRFRYYKPVFKEIDFSFDLAHGDGNLYNWQDIVISWVELAVHYRVNYSTQLFLGYKYMLSSNEPNIDFNGFYLNLVFGHSFIHKAN